MNNQSVNKYIRIDTVKKNLEYLKFMFQKNLEENTSSGTITVGQQLKDRIDLIDRIAISLEIEIRDTWDQDTDNLVICDICNEAVHPTEFVTFHRNNNTIRGHYECIEGFHIGS